MQEGRKLAHCITAIGQEADLLARQNALGIEYITQPTFGLLSTRRTRAKTIATPSSGMLLPAMTSKQPVLPGGQSRPRMYQPSSPTVIGGPGSGALSISSWQPPSYMNCSDPSSASSRSAVTIIRPAVLARASAHVWNHGGYALLEGVFTDSRSLVRFMSHGRTTPERIDAESTTFILDDDRLATPPLSSWRRERRSHLGTGTIASFWLARTNLIYGPALVVALLALAVAQMGIHLIFFLYITTDPDNTNRSSIGSVGDRGRRLCGDAYCDLASPDSGDRTRPGKSRRRTYLGRGSLAHRGPLRGWSSATWVKMAAHFNLTPLMSHRLSRLSHRRL
jgi:hypothetical protein